MIFRKIKEELSKKRYLDTLIHTLTATFLCVFLSYFLKVYSFQIYILIFLGSFLPDIDHLFLYKKKKFGNFKNFLRWIVKSNRYRVGFELFHNAPVIIIILLSLPYVYSKSKLAFAFFAAFIFHLIVDLILDKIIVGKIKWWRFGI